MKKIKETRCWEVVDINVQKGDIITSKRGIMLQGALTGEPQNVYKMKYLGKGRWMVLGNNREYIGEVKERHGKGR